MKKIVIIILIILLIVLIGVICFLFINRPKEPEKTPLEIKKEKLLSKIEEIESNIKIQVYFEKDIDDTHVEKVKKEVEKIEGVKSVEIITSEDAYKTMSEKFENQKEILEGYGANIFPNSMVVVLENAEYENEVTNKLENIEGIDKIMSSSNTLNTIIESIKKNIDELSEEEIDKYIEVLTENK